MGKGDSLWLGQVLQVVFNFGKTGQVPKAGKVFKALNNAVQGEREEGKVRG